MDLRPLIFSSFEPDTNQSPSNSAVALGLSSRPRTQQSPSDSAVSLRLSSRPRTLLKTQHSIPRLYSLLSIKSRLTQLFIKSLHKDMGHPEASTLLATIAEDYYVPRIKPFLKSVSPKCVICQKAYLKTTNQQMGMLPLDRTRPSPPFKRVKLGFAGPFTIRRGNPRKPTKVKAYACIFVCLVTRAIHLELCSDLSSEAFMATFQRFCARRGTPSHVFSDNGSNFLGAHNQLCELCGRMAVGSSLELPPVLRTRRTSAIPEGFKPPNLQSSS